MSHISYIHRRFTCAVCHQPKPLHGRIKHQVVGHDTRERPIYNYKCEDCAMNNKKKCGGKGNGK